MSDIFHRSKPRVLIPVTLYGMCSLHLKQGLNSGKRVGSWYANKINYNETETWKLSQLKPKRTRYRGGGGGDWGCRESQLSRKKEIFFLKKVNQIKAKNEKIWFNGTTSSLQTHLKARSHTSTNDVVGRLGTLRKASHLSKSLVLTISLVSLNLGTVYWMDIFHIYLL